MKALGEYYKSDWFIKRAEYYAKYRWTYPQAWPPPTLTDWLFIETDYEKFRKKEIDADLGECRIQIPEYEDQGLRAESWMNKPVLFEKFRQSWFIFM